MSRITEEHIECAAYALYRFDAQRHPIRHTTELDRWMVWKRVRASYVKRAELALLAVVGRELPPPEPPRPARAGEQAALALDAASAAVGWGVPVLTREADAVLRERRQADPGPEAPPLAL